jgi:hypothetical protein
LPLAAATQTPGGSLDMGVIKQQAQMHGRRLTSHALVAKYLARVAANDR